MGPAAALVLREGKSEAGEGDKEREGRTELLSAYQAQEGRGGEHMAEKQNPEPDLKGSVL